MQQLPGDFAQRARRGSYGGLRGGLARDRLPVEPAPPAAVETRPALRGPGGVPGLVVQGPRERELGLVR